MGSKVRVDINLKGLEKMVRDLKRKVEGDVPMTGLFNEAFMAEHTQFANILEMLEASPLARVPVEEMKEGFQRPEWSKFVNMNTRFPDWETMLNAAGNEELKRRLNMGSIAIGRTES